MDCNEAYHLYFFNHILGEYSELTSIACCRTISSAGHRFVERMV